MNISPNYQVIKVSEAAPGDLLFIQHFKHPVLAITAENSGNVNSLLELGEGGFLKDITPDFAILTCIKVCDEWRFKLDPTVSAHLISNPASAKNGQIVINEKGRFFISNLGGSQIPREAVVNLDNACYVDRPVEIGGEAFCFEWSLEINAGGDRGEELSNPLDIA